MPRTRTTFKPGCKRLPNAGRKKGTPNRFTTVKQDFLDAHEMIGGKEELAKWGRMHRSQFYVLLAKMLPNRVENTVPERPDMTEFTDEQLVAILESAKNETG